MRDFSRNPRRSGYGSQFSAGSEYKKLTTVLLRMPGNEVVVKNPRAVQQIAHISAPIIRKQINSLAKTFRKHGVRVIWLNSPWPGTPNLMYARDLFFMTPAGAVVARMAGEVRAGEEKHAALALAQLGIPILATISGTGTFEGADALWLNDKTVLCGVGIRTNLEGFRQLKGVLKTQGVETIPVQLTPGLQHLLGVVQIVDKNLAFARLSVVPSLRGLLTKRGYKVIRVRETPEVTSGQAMNVVTVAPRTVLMPKHCPELKEKFEKEGVKVLGELDISQLIRGGGGIACTTGIIGRR